MRDGGQWRRGLQNEEMRLWRLHPHPRGAKRMVKPRTRKDGGVVGGKRDRRRWRTGWEVRGEGSDFRGAVDWGRREGRGGSRLTSPAGERRDPERREHSCTGDRRV